MLPFCSAEIYALYAFKLRKPWTSTKQIKCYQTIKIQFLCKYYYFSSSAWNLWLYTFFSFFHRFFSAALRMCWYNVYNTSYIRLPMRRRNDFVIKESHKGRNTKELPKRKQTRLLLRIKVRNATGSFNLVLLFSILISINKCYFYSCTNKSKSNKTESTTWQIQCVTHAHDDVSINIYVKTTWIVITFMHCVHGYCANDRRAVIIGRWLFSFHAPAYIPTVLNSHSSDAAGLETWNQKARLNLPPNMNDGE